MNIIASKEQVLQAIRTINTEAYCNDIYVVLNRAGINVKLDSVYKRIRRLEQEGYLQSNIRQGIAIGRSRAQVYYTLTEKGLALIS